MAIGVALMMSGFGETARHAASIAGFLVFAGAVLWVFSCATALRAWLGVGLPALVLAIAVWWMTRL